jgi:PTS system nitrogen regulatory IIA component
MENILSELVQKGGTLYAIAGTSPEEILTNMIGSLPVPAGVDRKVLLDAILERESLMPTSIGHGIALPHPRNPIITDPGEQFVTIGFPQWSVDWRTLDGKPVHTLILIVSASARLHLHTLSQLNFFCQQDSFRDLLKRRASREEIVKIIAETEQAWK